MHCDMQVGARKLKRIYKHFGKQTDMQIGVRNENDSVRSAIHFGKT